jgi:CheY-like chemotaxis protein
VRILVVDPDATRARPLVETLTAAGADVTLAASGSFALTMLEWDRHDVVVSRARLGDMDGHELCGILRDDPGMKALRFALIARSEEMDTSVQSAGVDLILPATMSPTMMMTRITRLVPDDTSAPDEAPAPPLAAPVPPIEAPPSPAPEVARPDGEPSTESFAGSLDGTDLGELARAIAEARRTGHLLIALEGSGGVVTFDAGRVRHAEFGNETGQSAFTSLIGAARRERGGEFCFVADDGGGLRGTPRTVDAAIEELLRGERA